MEYTIIFLGGLSIDIPGYLAYLLSLYDDNLHGIRSMLGI